MKRFVALVAALPLLAPYIGAEEEDPSQFRSKEAGVEIKVPDGWDREYGRETEQRVFSAVLDAARGGKRIRFEVIAYPTANFDSKEWIAAKKTELGRILKDGVGELKVDEDREIGGRKSVGFTVEGEVRAGDGKTYPMRFKYYAVKNGEQVLEIVESSYNQAYKLAPKEIAALWDAIKFFSPSEKVLDTDAAGGDAVGEVKDEAGNYKLVLPKGWSVVGPPPPEGGTVSRMQIARNNADGEMVADVQILRFQEDAAVFERDVPQTWLKRRMQLWTAFYGERPIEPEMEGGVLLGGVDKSNAFKITSWTEDDYKKILEHEENEKKGIKDPDYKEPIQLVIRGRVAMLSPYVYLVSVRYGSRTLQNDAKLNAEIDGVLDTFALLNTKKRLPELQLRGQNMGVTIVDPALAKDRKVNLKVPKTNYVLPQHFKHLNSPGGQLKTTAVAQDKDHNSCVIDVYMVNTRAGRYRSIKDELQDSGKNWDNLVKGAGRIPRKPKPMKVGSWSGKGLDLTGRLHGFPAARKVIMVEKKGWRVIVEINYRGDGAKVFAKGVKTFLRKFKVKP